MFPKLKNILHEMLRQSSYHLDSNVPTINLDLLLLNVYLLASKDLMQFAVMDPTANKSPSYILKTNLCFKAVLAYRLAHAFYQLSIINRDVQAQKFLQCLAREISENAKVETGVEIHPAAQIAAPLVIDHGLGTVIGETAIIGSHCYILQGVIIGARGIANNPKGKRHPTLGSHVQIGAFAKLLGDINIGDNVFISPESIVTFDVPAHSKVKICTQMQISDQQNSIEIYGVVPDKGNKSFRIFGNNLDAVSVFVRTRHETNQMPIFLTLVKQDKRQITCLIPNRLKKANRPSYSLFLMNKKSEVVEIKNPSALN